MWHHLENQTITLGDTNGHTQNKYDLLIHILQAEDAMRPHVLGIQKEFQWTICGIVWVFILVGSYFRYILYSYLWQRHKMKESKPIDILILVATVIKHANIVSFVLGTTLMVLNDTSLEYIGQWYCVSIRLLYQFDACYSCVGSLGVSIFRILYIKNDQWVKYVIGEKALLNIILFGGLTLTAFFVLVLNIHDYGLFNSFPHGN